MSTPDARFNRRFVYVVVLSFLCVAACVVMRLGLGSTPYETTDSAGRAMGFNDQLSREHYLIMARNFSLRSFFALEYWYEWLLLLMHVIGAWLLLRPKRVGVRATRWFFAAQLLIFPIGVPFFWTVFPFVLGVFGGSCNREEFVDIPFFLFVAHPFWIIASLSVAIGLRGPGLGLSAWRETCVRVLRGGRRKLVEAVR